MSEFGSGKLLLLPVVIGKRDGIIISLTLNGVVSFRWC